MEHVNKKNRNKKKVNKKGNVFINIICTLTYKNFKTLQHMARGLKRLDRPVLEEFQNKFINTIFE